MQNLLNWYHFQLSYLTEIDHLLNSLHSFLTALKQTRTHVSSTTTVSPPTSLLPNSQLQKLVKSVHISGPPQKKVSSKLRLPKSSTKNLQTTRNPPKSTIKSTIPSSPTTTSQSPNPCLKRLRQIKQLASSNLSSRRFVHGLRSSVSHLIPTPLLPTPHLPYTF
ncbi:hypothetical protein GEMRC1_007699 [Eukaryota sp. GEM-RC1]